MKRRIALILVLCAAGVLGAAGETPLGEARRLFMTGEYTRARQALEKMLEADAANEPAAALLAELDIELGRFVEASQRCEAFLRRSPRAVRVRAMLAEALYARGQLDRAAREARSVRVLDPDNLRARYLTALIDDDRGRRIPAKRAFGTFIDVWQDTPEEKLSAEDVTFIGLGCTRFALADRNPAMLKTIVSTVYPLALRKDERYTPALIASGALFLEKYNTPQAEKDFQAVLRINPNHPLALLGLAQCELRERRFPEAHDFIERAAASAPDLPDVLLLDAVLSIYDEDFRTALAGAEKVLAVNPGHPEALGLKAACLFHLDRKDDYAAVEKHVVAVNPACSVFYETVASVLVTRHRDADAEPLLRKAVELAPNDSGPAALLGLLLMRRGGETEAYDVLTRAHDMDSFNVLVFNTLNLLDRMKGEFETRKTQHFTLKVHRKADEVRAGYVADYLEEVYPEVTRTYGHAVPHTLIEIFPDHRMFSVRTTGIPNVGTVGACLGPTIVMDSPAAGRPGMFNWRDVLRHEFTHVVTLSATDMKISHWFTEALAVSEESHPRPWEWYQLLVDALDRDEFMPVTKLNHGFTRARTQRRRQLAYAQSHFIAEFVTRRWGRDKLLAMLEAYRTDPSTATMIESVFGMKPEAFDAQFLDFARAELAGVNLSPTPLVRHQAEVEQNLAENPQTVELHVELARIKLARRDLTGAALAVGEALKLEPANARAHTVLGQVRLAQGNMADARKAFEKALQLDPKEVDAVRGLAGICGTGKDFDGQLKHLEALREMEPLNPAVHRAVARVHLKKNNEPALVTSLEEAARLDSQDYASRRELVRLMMDRTDYHSAAKYIDQAVAIWPYDRQLHEWAAVAFDRLGKTARAESEKALVPLSKPYRGGPETSGEPVRPVEH